MNAQQRRRIAVIAIGLAVLSAVGYGFLPRPAAVETAKARRGPLRVTVEEEGRTRVKNRFVVSAPVAGYLRRITLDVGDAVRKGDRVAALEPLGSTVIYPRSRAEAEAAVDAARAALNAAKEKVLAAAADAEYAHDRLARMRQLAGSGFIAKDDLDQAEAESKKAEANRLSAEAAVVTAQAQLEQAISVLRYSKAGGHSDTREDVIVRAPVNGTVLKLHRESEGVVNAGEPLVDISDPASLEVKAEVLSADAVKLREGTPVVFERWGGDLPLEGRVRTVEPAGFTKISSLGVEEQRVNVIVDLTSPAEMWRRLGDGYRLDATFIVWEGRDVLQVPASALFRRGDGWALFTIANRRAKLVDVEVGRRNGLAAQIVNGIAEDAVVITNPDDGISDGARVRPR
jgi:HlyD family secretion protein